ncbi:HD domain-containing protein [Diaminobutyricimonas aerilata]|uniref:HD domain-containing protein n=1 Tax=Diaminobutyricimonas aerilata TaxID=1162967 RepID=A0A2M9CHH1_9MICO|nr:HD domain-containing protein [Diaminobutyricimonas aerilata]PJJ71363.1 HD domain-containing protein [Diaminobutyricimonas aerilata]
MSSLARAVEIATRAHEGRVDAAGRPAVEHSFAVAALVRTVEQKTVAMLHEVVERGDHTVAELREEGFDAHVLAALDALRPRDGERLEHTVARILHGSAGCALEVKRADIAHEASRLHEFDEVTRRRLEPQLDRTARLLGTTLDALVARVG